MGTCSSTSGRDTAQYVSEDPEMTAQSHHHPCFYQRNDKDPTSVTLINVSETRWSLGMMDDRKHHHLQ
jgi:hypothetical protein